MRRGLLLLIAGAAIALPSLAAGPDGASILQGAETQAASSGKNVLVIYHASWCGWCHKLDDFLKAPKISAIMDKNYVPVVLDVMESPDKKSLETPGGNDMMKSMGGEKAGLPYYVIMSPKGKTLITSAKDPGGNIGYPAKPDEIEYFMKMLQTTGKHLSSSDADLMRKTLTELAPKDNGH